MSSTKLLVILRGNKPLLLDKIMYKEHSLSKELKDCSVSEYNPIWTRNSTKKVQVSDKKKDIEHQSKKKSKIDWETF